MYLRSSSRALTAAVALSCLIGLTVSYPASASTGRPAAAPAQHPQPPLSRQSRSKTAAKWTTGASSGKPTSRSAATALAYPVAKDGEVPALRTQNSRTYKGGKTYRTIESLAPVNYRDAAGAWTPIDNTLVAASSSGGVRNRANNYAVSFPARSNGTISAVRGNIRVDSTLIGAASAALRTTGSTATYPSVYPGVDAIFVAQSTGYEETLRLNSRAVQASFSSRVSVAAGTTLVAQPDGSMAVIASDGTVRGALSVPVMTDASGRPDSDVSTAVRYSLTGTAPHYLVTMTPSRAWLNAAARVYPVLLDPSTTFGTANDLGCYVTNPGSGSPSDPKLCAANSGTDNALVYGSTAYVRRAFIQFGDLTGASSAVPADAVVSNANLTLTELTASNTAALDTVVERPTTAWTSAITWSGQPATSGTLFDRLSVVPPGAGATVTFNPTSLVQAYVRSGSPNYGFQLRLLSEAPSNTLQFYGLANATHAPTLTVTWAPALGQQSWVQAYDHTLTDRMDVHVDLADRNLVLNATDDSITGPGESLVVRRTYNSLSAAAGASGAWGTGWTMNGGVDTGLTIGRQQINVTRPGGAQGPFTRNLLQPLTTVTLSAGDPNGPSWLTAPGWKSDLVTTDSTHYTLTDRVSHEVETFTMPTSTSTSAWLSKVADGNGNAVTYASSGSPLATTTETDATGQRSVGFSYTGSVVTAMSETLAGTATGARNYSYGYTAGSLTSYTDPAGKITRYCYTGALITKIISPRGTAAGATCSTTNGTDVTDIAYDSSGHVNSIGYEHSTGGSAVIGFAAHTPLVPGGTSGVTRETDAYGKNTDYTYDPYDRVTRVLTPLGYTTTATFNTSNDVTASVDQNNYTGGGGDPSTTRTFTGENLTKVTIPGAVSVTAGYTGTEQDQPNQVSDDRDQSSGNLTSASATDYAYNSAGQLMSTSKGSATATVRHEGDTGVAHCGPSAGAAYLGAVCETRDADYNASVSTSEHRTLYGYDALGQLVSLTPPQPDHSRTTPPAQTFTYDGQSRLSTSTDSRGKTTTYAYDALDRPTQVTYSDGTYTSYGWDADGDELSAIDYSSSGIKITGRGDTRTYDDQNRLATDTEDGQETISQVWDGNSRLLTYNDGSGAGVGTYGYNDDGALTSFTEPGGNCAGFDIHTLPSSTSNCIIFDVDKTGHRIGQYNPSASGTNAENWIYNTAGQISEIDDQFGQLLYNYSNGTANTAHIFGQSDNIGSYMVDSTTYSYGNEGRLTSTAFTAASGSPANTYALNCYDPNGNRTSTSSTAGASCPGSASVTYDGANQQLGTGTGYDLAGNETSMQTSVPAASSSRTSTWSNAQQLLSTSINGASALTNTYYGAANNLLVQDGTGTGVSDKSRNGPLGLSRISHYSGTSLTSALYVERDPSGTIIALRPSTTTSRYYPIVNNLGSIIFLISNTDVQVAAYTYSASGQQTANAANTYSQPFGFDGAYTNPGSGLTHFGARWLDPTLGRFTQPDGLAHPGDTSQSSPYPYAGDDPVNNTDLSGQSIFGDIVVAAVAVVGLAAIPLEAPVVATGAAVVGTALALDYVACDFDSGIDCDFY